MRRRSDPEKMDCHAIAPSFARCFGRARRNDEVDVSAAEARGYYDQLISMGVLELAESIGSRDVFCTLWQSINEQIEAEKSAE